MKYLSDYMSEAQSAEFNKAEAFFCFGSSQFHERKKEGVKYVDMGAGLVCPKDNAKTLSEALKSIFEKAIDLDVKENGAEAIIEREYFNHECQIGDLQDAVDSLGGHIEQYPELFTPEVLQRVFQECWNKAVKNDWF